MFVCLDVRFQVFLYEIAMISGASAVIFGVQNLVFASRVFPFWYPGGSFWKLGEAREAMGAAGTAPWGPGPDFY